MEKDILNFNKQFSYVPEIITSEKIRSFKKIVVCGMGGSHLAADIIKDLLPFAQIKIWSDYGLPPIAEVELEETLFIASSYSGNTEEPIGFANVAFENKHNLICISIGGALLEFAKKHTVPYIQIPDTGLEPRLALGFSALAIAKASSFTVVSEDLASLTIEPQSFKKIGEELAKAFEGKIPVFYSSLQYRSVGMISKIKINETAKIPSFYNVFPELNHNEMQSFGGKHGGGRDNICFVFFAAKDDHPRVLERMEVTEKLLQEHGFDVHMIWMTGEKKSERIFSTLLIADWTALKIAEASGIPPAEVPMVEQFKKMLN